MKTIECYEPILEHNSYFNLMGHGAPSHHHGHHLASLSPSLYSPTDGRAPADSINGRPTINQAAKTRPCDQAWIMAQTVAVQQHALLQTTQLHTAINAHFFNNSHISVDLNIKNFIVYLFLTLK